MTTVIGRSDTVLIPRLMALAIGGFTLLIALAIVMRGNGGPTLAFIAGAGGIVLMLSTVKTVSRRQWRLGAQAFLWLAVLTGVLAVVAAAVGEPIGIALLLLVDAALAASAYLAAHQFGRRMERSLLITHYLRD